MSRRKETNPDVKLVDKTLSRVDSYNRSLIEASLDPLVTITLDGKIGDVNAATELITGRTRDELIGTDFSDYFTEPDKARAGYRQAFTDGSARDYELSIRNRDGRVRPVLYNASVYRDEAGNGIGVFAAARDITERKRVENLIQQDAARAETMAEISRSLVESGTDPQAILNAVARTTATIIGDACIIRLLSNDGERLDPAAIYHADPKTLAFLQEKFAGLRQRTNNGLAGHVFKTGQPVLMPAVSFEELSDLASHHYVAILENVGVSSLLIVPLRTQVSIIGTLALFRIHSENPFTVEDQALLESLAGQAALAITNARLYKDLANALQQELAMREQLIRAEKHMAISRMVASVAHEINNPLQTIQNCMYLAEQEVPVNSEIREYIEMASSESKRISSLVAQLREVYRPGQTGSKQPVDLLKTLEDTHALLTPHLAHQNIHWVKAYRLNEHPEDQPMINGFVDEIKQVFLNLSMNAIEAMQPQAGTLTVGLIQNTSGDQVGVYFQDSGPGIPNENLEKLFEPFFTTKDSGVGLGLSICYEIIQRHGGHIDVTNVLDHGAKFTVWLPVSTTTPNSSS